MTLKTFVLPSGLGCALLGTALAFSVACGDSKPGPVHPPAMGGAGGGVSAAGGAGGGAGAAGGAGGSAGAAGGAGGSAGAAGGAGGAVGTPIAISGVASPFPNDPETDFTSLALVIADPLDVLAGKPPLAMMAPFATTGPICPDAGAGAGCVVPYTFPSVTVDPAKSILGLLAIFQDLRPGTSDGGVAAKWVRTGTGIANTAQLAAAVASGSLTGRPVYAVSTKLEAMLSTFAFTVAGTTPNLTGLTGAPGELAAKGFVLAMILANGTPTPTPVEGATFAPPASANGKFAILYPKADFSGVGTSTSAKGLVLIFPLGSATTAPVTPWSVTPPSGSTATWPTQVVGVQANGAVVLLDVSN